MTDYTDLKIPAVAHCAAEMKLSKRVKKKKEVRNVFVRGGVQEKEMFNGHLKDRSGFLVALFGFCGFVLEVQHCSGLRLQKVVKKRVRKVNK